MPKKGFDWEDLTHFKVGDTVRIKIDYERLRKDRKFNGMTGVIVGDVKLRALAEDNKKETVVDDFEYIVYLHRKRELCVFGKHELEFDDDRVHSRKM